MEATNQYQTQLANHGVKSLSNWLLKNHVDKDVTRESLENIWKNCAKASFTIQMGAYEKKSPSRHHVKVSYDNFDFFESPTHLNGESMPFLIPEDFNSDNLRWLVKDAVEVGSIAADRIYGIHIRNALDPKKDNNTELQKAVAKWEQERPTLNLQPKERPSKLSKNLNYRKLYAYNEIYRQMLGMDKNIYGVGWLTLPMIMEMQRELFRTAYEEARIFIAENLKQETPPYGPTTLKYEVMAELRGEIGPEFRWGHDPHYPVGVRLPGYWSPFMVVAFVDQIYERGRYAAVNYPHMAKAALSNQWEWKLGLGETADWPEAELAYLDEYQTRISTVIRGPPSVLPTQRSIRMANPGSKGRKSPQSVRRRNIKTNSGRKSAKGSKSISSPRR